jgi:hypothetical protein
MQCDICYENYNNKQEKILLKCSHRFCSKCLLKLITTNKSCPFCREKIELSKLTLGYIIRYAIAKNNRELFNYTIDNNKSIVNDIDEHGNTPLHWACKYKKFINEIFSLNPISCINFKGLKPTDYLTDNKFNNINLIEKNISIENEFILTDLIFKKDFVNFKKQVLGGKIPTKLLIGYIKSNNLEDYKGFLEEAGFI